MGDKQLKLIENLLLVFILVFATGFMNHWWHLKLVLMTFILIGHFTMLRTKYPIAFWSVTLLLVSLDLLQYYFLAANHSFVLFYMTLMILIAHFYPKKQLRIIQINSISILFIVMLLGAVQKILSPTFMNGDFISFITLRGELFKPLQIAELIPDVFKENLSLIREERTTIPNSELKIQLKTPFVGYEKFVCYFSIFIAVFEFLMLPVLLLKRKMLKNTIIALFLIGLLITRLETGFICLLTILSIAQLPENEKTFRLIYIGLFAVCLAMILARIGLR